MTVTLAQQAVILSGKCGVEEVETLLACLESAPHLPVDLADAVEVHTSLWQALMFLQPRLLNLPAATSMSKDLISVLSRKFDLTPPDNAAKLAD